MTSRKTKSAEKRLLNLLSDIQQNMLRKEPNLRALFEQILQFILDETQSEYGFIGRVIYDKKDNPYLKTYAIKDISWDKESHDFYKKNAAEGLEFRNLNTHFDRLIQTGEVLITNQPSARPRVDGLPQSQLLLSNFAGLPIENPDENRPAGMFGIANRPGGYSAEQFAFFRPLLLSCASLLQLIESGKMVQADELRTQNLLETIGEACWEIDLIGMKVLQANPPSWKLFNCTKDQFYGQVDWAEKSIHPEDTGLLQKQNFRLLRTGRADFSHRILRSDGKIRTVFIRKKIIKNEKGSPVRLLCIAVDLSRTEQDRLQIEESQNLYKHIFESVPQGIFVLDKTDLRIISLNRSAGALFADDETEPVGRLFSELLPENISAETLSRNRAEVFEMHSFSGKELHGEINLTEVKKDGRNCFLAVVNDVTESVLDREKIENLLDRSRRLNEELFAGKDDLRKALIESEFLNRELFKNRERLRAIYAAIPDILIIADHEGRIMDISSGGRDGDLYISKKEATGRTIHEIFPAEQAAFFQDKIDKCLISNNLEQFEYKLKTGEEEKTFEGRIMPILGKLDGKPSIIWMARNITKRINTDKRFQLIFETTPIAFIISDREGKIRTVNRQAQDLFGYEAGEMEDLEIENLVPSRFHKYHKNVREEFADDPAFREMGMDRAVFARKKDSSECPVTINLNFLTIGDEILILSSITDISESQKQAENLKKLTRDLLRRNKELEEFAYIISHNVRAPVANIQGLLSIYDKTDSVSEFNLDLLGHMEKASTDLDSITRELNIILGLKRHVHDARETIQFNFLTKDILGMLEAQIDDKASVKTDFSACPEVYSIKRYLRNILLHLIENSLKFRSPDRPCEIKIRTFRDDENFCLEVRDNGLGIDMEKFGHRLFGLYNRSHTHVEGKGLGLHMVKTQVEALGGKVGAESRPDKGSIFSAYIPLISPDSEI